MSSHLFDNHVDGVTYCSRCGIWDGAAPAECQKLTRRDHLVLEIERAGKSWWPTVRSKANHARMSRAELQLWEAIRDLKAHDGEDVR